MQAVGIGDLPAALQDRELTNFQEEKRDAQASVAEVGGADGDGTDDLQEEKRDAQTSVAEAENAVIINKLFAHDRIRACHESIWELMLNIGARV